MHRISFGETYLYGVQINKNIFKLFQEEETRCHALSSWDGIYDRKTASYFKPCNVAVTFESVYES